MREFANPTPFCRVDAGRTEGRVEECGRRALRMGHQRRHVHARQLPPSTTIRPFTITVSTGSGNGENTSAARGSLPAPA